MRISLSVKNNEGSTHKNKILIRQFISSYLAQTFFNWKFNIYVLICRTLKKKKREKPTKYVLCSGY